MPDVNKSYVASTHVVLVGNKSYTASVSTAQLREYTASVVTVIQPDRFVTGTVEVVPNGGVYIGYNASVYAFFVPITPDRYFTGSVRTVATLILGEFYTGSVVTVVPSTINQVYQATVLVNPPSTNITYTASTIAKALDQFASYTAKTVVLGTLSQLYFASVETKASTTISVTATVVAKKFDENKTYTASVRPFIDISPGEHSVRDADIALLIALVFDRNRIQELLLSLTAQLAFDLAEIIRLVDILQQVTNKPSCRLSTISPNTEIPRTGGTIITCFGDEFIPTCEVHLFQGATEVATIETLVTSKQVMTFETPDFTSVIGLVLTNPISIEVLNADGEISETLTFTLAAS